MNKVVWKFELNSNSLYVAMPKGAEILTVQAQNNVPCLWALVDPYAMTEHREIERYQTGYTIYSGVERKFLGTVQLDAGATVLHVFERLPQ